MIVLINTAEPQAYIALVKDGKQVAERRTKADKTLGSWLLLTLDELLVETGIDKIDLKRIAVYRGPGHFMSLRTGITTATALAQGLNIDLVAVDESTIAAASAQAQTSQPTRRINPRYDANGS